MELTSALIQRAPYVAQTPRPGRVPIRTARRARQGRHQIAMTLVSLWEREGRFVSPALLYELRLHRDLQTSLREVRDQQSSQVPRSGSLRALRSRRCIRRACCGR